MKNTNTERIKVVCLECGRTWKVSPNAVTLQCTRCNSVDIDVKD
jgi:hypothetical protein